MRVAGDSVHELLDTTSGLVGVNAQACRHMFGDGIPISGFVRQSGHGSSRLSHSSKTATARAVWKLIWSYSV